ncbi:MAG: MIP family channel protein [Verrucomicrobiota bacterium]|jgi:aquaporin Z|nr:MIP family channel protein [Verrucomicrobiota bacterium]
MQLSRQCAAEVIGTFILVFTGTGAVVFNEISGGQVTPLGIGLVFGLVVMALIYTLGDISGTHINPAVTLGFWASGQFDGKRVLPYILAQCSGALLASLLLRGLFGKYSNMGATLPIVVNDQPLVYECLILEIILTFILMFVILNVATGAKEKGLFTGIVVGGVIALEAVFAGPISGASMNPARSLGPAVASSNFTAFWIYITGPVVGSLLAIPTWRFVAQSSESTEAIKSD